MPLGAFRWKTRPHLEEGAENSPEAALIAVACRKDTLYQDLVHRPAEAADAEDAEPRTSGFVSGPNHREHRRVQSRLQAVPAADALETGQGENERAAQQHGRLNRIGIDDGTEAALHRVERGHQADNPDDCQPVPAEQSGEDDRAGLERD